jgi:hypothetical protein
MHALGRSTVRRPPGARSMFIYRLMKTKSPPS